MTIMRSLPSFFWKYSSECLMSFVKGYREIKKYDKNILMIYHSIYLVNYYLKTLKKTPRIAGIPISRLCLQKMVEAAIKHDDIIERIFKNIKL